MPRVVITLEDLPESELKIQVEFLPAKEVGEEATMAQLAALSCLEHLRLLSEQDV